MASPGRAKALSMYGPASASRPPFRTDRTRLSHHFLQADRSCVSSACAFGTKEIADKQLVHPRLEPNFIRVPVALLPAAVQTPTRPGAPSVPVPG
jgi:hypothetical protein